VFQFADENDDSGEQYDSKGNSSGNWSIQYLSKELNTQLWHLPYQIGHLDYYFSQISHLRIPSPDVTCALDLPDVISTLSQVSHLPSTDVTHTSFRCDIWPHQISHLRSPRCHICPRPDVTSRTGWFCPHSDVTSGPVQISHLAAQDVTSAKTCFSQMWHLQNVLFPRCDIWFSRCHICHFTTPCHI
jgi:hypothetical protein